jgi:hypothetical protein
MFAVAMRNGRHNYFVGTIAGSFPKLAVQFRKSFIRRAGKGQALIKPFDPLLYFKIPSRLNTLLPRAGPFAGLRKSGAAANALR